MSLDKIAWIIFIVRQEIPRNIKRSPFLIIGHHLRHPHLSEKMSVRIDCYAHFASYASQVSTPITHYQGVHDRDSFISGGIFGTARPPIIFNALSLPLKLCCPFCHCAIRRLLPKAFYEVFMNFFGRHCFLKEVYIWWPLWFQVSPIYKCVALSSLKDALHKQPITTACFSNSRCPSIRSNNRLANIYFQFISQKHIRPRTFWSHLVFCEPKICA